MEGRRLADTHWPDLVPGEDLRDGDYWRCQGAPGAHGWCLYFRGAARIPLHFVDEHDDGTISVLPQPNGESQNSVLITRGGVEIFHGWIRHGVWTPT